MLFNPQARKGEVHADEHAAGDVAVGGGGVEGVIEGDEGQAHG